MFCYMVSGLLAALLTFSCRYQIKLKSRRREPDNSVRPVGLEFDTCDLQPISLTNIDREVYSEGKHLGAVVAATTVARSTTSMKRKLLDTHVMLFYLIHLRHSYFHKKNHVFLTTELMMYE